MSNDMKNELENEMKNDTRNYGKITIAIILVWFASAATASALHVFENAANRIGISVAVAALTPLILFSVWFAASDSFRNFALSLNPRALTSVQAWRIIGFSFVLLEARNTLPAVFALPAGYGDMLIGATAAFAAWKLADPAHRTSFIAWQILGIVDLFTAVTLGITAGFLAPQAPSIAPMTTLPLSLIPTFLVCLFTMLHIICIAQAVRWHAASVPVRPTISSMHSSAI